MLKAIQNHEQFIKLWRKIRSENDISLKVSTKKEFDNARNIVQSLGGNLSEDYISKLLIAINYATTHYHKGTGKTLFDALISGQRVFLSSYEERVNI